MLQLNGSLLERCVRKDSAAQFELYTCLRNDLLSIARRYERDALLRNAMVNNAFLKILDHLPERDPSAPFEAWCRRITINTVLNEQRDRRSADRAIVHMEVSHADQLHSMEVNGVEEMIETEELQYMMDRLPSVSRQVFNLYAIDGWKHREIAERLHISEGTSKWHVNHARQLLQAMLAKATRPHLVLQSA
ncbi:MAG: sigma-70 family RNA polymerase sigma factor [Flavobacteriales bacterium]|nr:sigma-70 family RNA polymerase sigma factor [Flavobacteriales bacterium]